MGASSHLRAPLHPQVLCCAAGGIGTGCPGNGGVTVPGGVKDKVNCGTKGHGLVGAVGMG